VYGNRFALGVADGDGDDTSFRASHRNLRVLDFNRFAIRRTAGEEKKDGAGGGGDDEMDGLGGNDNQVDFEAEDNGNAGSGDREAEPEHKAQSRTVTVTSVIPKGAPFLVDVHSSLPYREITKRVSHPPFMSVMIDDERVICITGDRNAWVHTI